MEIKTLSELGNVLKKEKALYMSPNKRRHPVYLITKPLSYRIWSFQRTLRVCEYLNSKTNPIAFVSKLYFEHRLFRFGSKIGIEIYPGSFGEGLKIYHTGIIVNKYAIIGKNCKLHGMNCIGNNGKDEYATPHIGDNFDMGVNSTVIGSVTIGNNVVAGAGCVVTKSFEDNSVIVGIPAKMK